MAVALVQRKRWARFAVATVVDGGLLGLAAYWGVTSVFAALAPGLWGAVAAAGSGMAFVAATLMVRKAFSESTVVRDGSPIVARLEARVEAEVDREHCVGELVLNRDTVELHCYQSAYPAPMMAAHLALKMTGLEAIVGALSVREREDALPRSERERARVLHPRSRSWRREQITAFRDDVVEAAGETIPLTFAQRETRERLVRWLALPN